MLVFVLAYRYFVVHEEIIRHYFFKSNFKQMKKNIFFEFSTKGEIFPCKISMFYQIVLDTHLTKNFKQRLKSSQGCVFLQNLTNSKIFFIVFRVLHTSSFAFGPISQFQDNRMPSALPFTNLSARNRRLVSGNCLYRQSLGNERLVITLNWVHFH